MKELKELAKKIVDIVSNMPVKEVEKEDRSFFRLYESAKDFVNPKPNYPIGLQPDLAQKNCG